MCLHTCALVRAHYSHKVVQNHMLFRGNVEQRAGTPKSRARKYAKSTIESGSLRCCVCCHFVDCRRQLCKRRTKNEQLSD